MEPQESGRRAQKFSQDQQGGQFSEECLGRKGNTRKAGQGSRGKSVARDEDQEKMEG
jgi:hypothetical protein